MALLLWFLSSVVLVGVIVVWLARKNRWPLAISLTVILVGVAVLQLFQQPILETLRSTAAPTMTAAPTSGPPPPSTTTSAPSPPPPPPPPPSTTASTAGEFTLANYNPVQTYAINVDRSPREVNGVMYADPVAWAASIGADDPYWAEWNLSRKCDSFTVAGVGIADQAPSDSRYLFRILIDGSEQWQQTMTVGQSQPLKVSVKGALRLRLSVAGLEKGYYGAYATWGDAKVTCDSEPPNKKS